MGSRILVCFLQCTNNIITNNSIFIITYLFIIIIYLQYFTDDLHNLRLLMPCAHSTLHCGRYHISIRVL